MLPLLVLEAGPAPEAVGPEGFVNAGNALSGDAAAGAVDDVAGDDVAVDDVAGDAVAVDDVAGDDVFALGVVELAPLAGDAPVADCWASAPGLTVISTSIARGFSVGKNIRVNVKRLFAACPLIVLVFLVIKILYSGSAAMVHGNKRMTVASASRVPMSDKSGLRRVSSAAFGRASILMPRPASGTARRSNTPSSVLSSQRLIRPRSSCQS